MSIKVKMQVTVILGDVSPWAEVVTSALCSALGLGIERPDGQICLFSQSLGYILLGENEFRNLYLKL